MKSMTTNASQEWKKSGISVKYPSYRNKPFISTQSWLRGKQKDDQAEGLWRIHNDLYDMTDFVIKHPGGSFWLEQTKGTDITELFETHHIRGVPQTLLEKFYVRKAAKPRNYKFTLKENGFYRTLKKRVAENLKKLDYGPRRRTFFYHLGLLTSTLLLSIIASWNINFIFELLAALSLAWLGIIAHNYFHQRDNWQMYTFNLTLMNFAEWRISHVLSHHHYTNSMHDLEMSLFEPFLCWIPNPQIASKGSRIIMMIFQPLIYAGIWPLQFLQRFLISIFYKNQLFWHDLIGFSLPVIMMLFSSSSSSPHLIALQWLRIICISSFLFGLISVNSSHHTPENYHDGDAVRKDLDWGLYQLDTITDRCDIKKSQFMVLTHFGEHALHHLFPTLDHGVLPQLYSIFFKTLEEFKGELRDITFFEHLIKQNQQLLRTKANPIAPCECKRGKD